jgi:hypothetical protein
VQSYAYFANVVCLFVAKSSFFGPFSRFSHNEFPKVNLPEWRRGFDGLHRETLVAITVNGSNSIVKLSPVMSYGDLITSLSGADEIAGIGNVNRIVVRRIYIINKVVTSGIIA